MGHTRSCLHADHSCCDQSGSRLPHPEEGALWQGLGREEEDIVHTETDYIADSALTSVPDTPHEVNTAEEDRIKGLQGVEVGVLDGVNYSEEHLDEELELAWSLRCKLDLFLIILNESLLCAFD